MHFDTGPERLQSMCPYWKVLARLFSEWPYPVKDFLQCLLLAATRLQRLGQALPQLWQALAGNVVRPQAGIQQVFRGLQPAACQSQVQAHSTCRCSA